MTARDTTYDVFDARLADKMSDMAMTDIELAKAVKQIRPLPGSGADRNVEDVALLGDDRAHRSIRRDRGRYLGATEGETHAEDERTEDACSPTETTHSGLDPAINSHNMSFISKDRQSRRSDAPLYHRVVKRIPQRILPLTPGMLAIGTLVENLGGCLGQKPAAAYDFDLQLGGLYEAQRGGKSKSKHTNLRTRIKRLVRWTICFSKTKQMHDPVIGLFINRYAFARHV